MRFKAFLLLIGVLASIQVKAQMVRFGGNITGISYTQVSGDTFQIRGTFNDLTGVSNGTQLDSNDVFWNPPLNAGDTCRRTRIISADTLYLGFVVFTVDMLGQGNPSTQNSKVMRETPNQNLDYIPQGGDEALRECIAQYYSNILDNAIGQGGGLASVLVDSLTILGDGLTDSLRVDTNFFVTYSAFRDSLGDGMYQEVFIADGISNTYQMTLDTVLPNDSQDILVAWNGQLLDDAYIGALDAPNGTLQLTFMPDAGDRIVVIWFDGDVVTQSSTVTGLDSVFTGMYLLGNGTLLNPLTIDTMYTASKAYVDNSIAEAGAGDITGVNETPQYGINGGGASGAILLSADTTVLASKTYVDNNIASNIDSTRLTQDSILVYYQSGTQIGSATIRLPKGIDSVVTDMYIIGNGLPSSPLSIDTMYTASKAYVDASIAAAGGGDITGVNESPQYGILGGGASGAVNLSADTSVLASKTYVVNIIPNNAVTSVSAGSYMTGGTITSTGTIGADATTTNTGNKLVARDASGNFSAGTITATLNGNASTATKLQSSRTIAFGGHLSGSNTFDGSSNITISGQVADDSHNHVISNVDNLQTSLNAKQDNLSGTGIVKSTAGTISYLTDNSTNWTTAYNDKIISASVTGTTTKTITLTQQDGGTVTTNFTDLSGGGITATNGGNNRLATFSGTSSIDGDNGFWVNQNYELVDNQTDGLAAAATGYQLKLSHTAFIDSIVTNDITMQGNLVLDNNLEVLGTSNFDGSVGDSYFYPSGALGIQTTPSGNLSLTTRYGATFNTDNNSINGDVTMNGATINNLFNLDASEDAIAIGGATPASSFDLKTSKGVWINSSYSGGIYDGLLVSGDTDIYLLNVDADRDKVGVNKLQPNYTLDVDGDINFTGTLRKNGTEYSAPYSFVMSFDLNSDNDQRIMIPSIYNGCVIDNANLIASTSSYTGSVNLSIGTVSGGAYSSSVLTSWSFTSNSGAVADENTAINHTISSDYTVQGSYVTTSGTISKVVISFSIECN